MRRFLYDTAVFVYAVGGAHPYREPCREITARAAAGELRGEASVDLVQEFLHQRTRRLGDRGAAARDARDVASLCRLHEARPSDVPLALTLYSEYERLSARDAFFAALALNRGIDVVLSPDRGFDGLAGLERIDPADEAAVAVLATEP